MDELPAGFERREVDGATVVARSDLVEALLAAGVDDPEALARRAPSGHTGRAGLGRIELGAAGAAIVRPLVRGGLVGLVVRRRSLDPGRALAELRLCAEASARGASVLEVLAAVTRRDGVGYTHGLVTREVVAARDLLAALRASEGPRARGRALAAAGRAIRRLHDAGVDHVDLNLKNVLLRADGEALILDLDRCRLTPGPASERVRQRNLLRLLRSWRKLAAAEARSVQARDPLRLARAYARGERELLRRLVSAGRRARFPLHRLRWRLLPPRLP